MDFLTGFACIYIKPQEQHHYYVIFFQTWRQSKTTRIFMYRNSCSHFVIHNGPAYSHVCVLERNCCNAHYQNLSALATETVWTKRVSDLGAGRVKQGVNFRDIYWQSDVVPVTGSVVMLCGLCHSFAGEHKNKGWARVSKFLTGTLGYKLLQRLFTYRRTHTHTHTNATPRTFNEQGYVGYKKKQTKRKYKVDCTVFRLSTVTSEHNPAP